MCSTLLFCHLVYTFRGAQMYAILVPPFHIQSKPSYQVQTQLFLKSYHRITSCTYSLFLHNFQEISWVSLPPFLQTGNSAPLMATPLLSTIAPIYGPMTGIFLAKPAIVPRKSPNKIKMPYNSTKNPINGHLMRISVSPAKKAPVPLSFCFRAKNNIVFCGPIIMVSPIRKRI